MAHGERCNAIVRNDDGIAQMLRCYCADLGSRVKSVVEPARDLPAFHQGLFAFALIELAQRLP